MMHHRKKIRKYVKELLKSEVVEVAGRVYSGRLSPRFLETLPCICISFAGELNEPHTGGATVPIEYLRRFRLMIDILVRDTRPDDDSDPEDNDTAEDLADDITEQVEAVLGDDYLLARMLLGYNDNRPEGLCEGIVFVRTDPYNMGKTGENKAVAHRLTIEIPYVTPAFIERKTRKFSSYKVSIAKENGNPDNPLDILTSAEGKV